MFLRAQNKAKIKENEKANSRKRQKNEERSLVSPVTGNKEYIMLDDDTGWDLIDLNDSFDNHTSQVSIQASNQVPHTNTNQLADYASQVTINQPPLINFPARL